MKINKTIYAESIELIVLGSTRWRKVGLEADLDEGEDAVKSSIELKKTVDEIHRLNNVDIDVYSPAIPNLPPTELTDEQKLYQKKVNACKTMEQLLKLAKAPSGMRGVYNQKVNELKLKKND